MDTGVIEGGLNVTLTIRLLMHGKVRDRPGTPASGAWSGEERGRDDDPSGSFRGSWGRECAPWHPASSRVSRDEREKSAAWPQKYQLGEGEMTRCGGGMSWGGPRGQEIWERGLVLSLGQLEFWEH